MAPRPGSRLTPQVIDADRLALRGLSDLSDYAPINITYSVEALKTLEVALAQAEHTKLRAQRALDQARDDAAAAAWALHEAMLGAKAQVIAQYGSDSPAIEALGLKKKSKRRPQQRRRPSISM